jgi:BirA family biotin operon repressor/biotin-[acetyl-CoA-carboxylase] ligase
MLASIVLYPHLPFERTVELSFVTAIATAEALREIGLDARIKWPNDVLVRGRKICGILIETVSRIGEKPAAIVGIGINVNWKSIDPEITQTATSVALELGHDEPVQEILDLLLARLAPLYETFLKDGFTQILKRWCELQCTVGTNVKVAVEGKTISGKAVGVDDDGSLLVETDSEIITVTAAGTLLAEG